MMVLCRSTPAEEVGTFIVTVEKERRARAATEPTLSSEVQIAVEGSAALPPAASQRETHEVEVEVINEINDALVNQEIAIESNNCQF